MIPYADLNDHLDLFQRRIREVLSNQLVGLYLQGSFAVGGFDRDSDVDFVAIVRDELPPEIVALLNAMHDRLCDRANAWAGELEGSYFTKVQIGDLQFAGQPVPYVDRGHRRIEYSPHCNSLVVRAALRRHGVVLFGPPPDTLVPPIPRHALRREIHRVIVDWGGEILADPDRWNNRFYQSFIVLHHSRALHDLHRGFPGAKPDGAAWAKVHFGPRWHALIDRAWPARHNAGQTARESADSADFLATLEFVRLTIARASDLMAGFETTVDEATI